METEWREPLKEPLEPRVEARSTRWIFYAVEAMLVVFGLSLAWANLGRWRTWNAMGEVLAGLADFWGGTGEGWLLAIRIVMGLVWIAALSLIVLAWGLWRRSSGAWLALLVVTVLMLTRPASLYFMWGPQSFAAQGWIGWMLLVMLTVAFVLFLLRPATRAFFTRPAGRAWRISWIALSGYWVFLAFFAPLSAVALKVYLHRERNIPFWRFGGMEDVTAKAAGAEAGETEMGNVYGFTFPLPVGAGLMAFPNQEDREWGIVGFATDSEGDRRVVLLSPPIADLIPESVKSNLGADDAVGLMRALHATNWSFMPLVFSNLNEERVLAVYSVSDDEREAVAVVLPARSGERFRMTITVQFPGVEGAWDLTYSPHQQDNWAALAAEKIGAMRWRVSDEHGDSRLLRNYWNGDIEAGVALAENLLNREKPRRRLAERLLLEIQQIAPDHPGADALRTMLEQETDGNQEEPGEASEELNPNPKNGGPE